MEYTIREAATLMGLHPRTVRRLVAAGKIAGVKREGAWMVPRSALPTTPARDAARRQAAATVRETTEAAVASAGRHSVLDLGAVVHLHHAARSLAEGDPARALLEEALADVAAGAVAFHLEEKVPLLRRGRVGVCRAIAHLALRSELPLAPPVAAVVAELEREALPGLAGLLRRAERHGPHR